MGSSDSSLCSPESHAAFQLPLAPHTHTHTHSVWTWGRAAETAAGKIHKMFTLDWRQAHKDKWTRGLITFLTVVLCASLSCRMLFAVATAWNVFGKTVPWGKQEHMTSNRCNKSPSQFMNWNLKLIGHSPQETKLYLIYLSFGEGPAPWGPPN